MELILDHKDNNFNDAVMQIVKDINSNTSNNDDDIQPIFWCSGSHVGRAPNEIELVFYLHTLVEDDKSCLTALISLEAMRSLTIRLL